MRTLKKNKQRLWYGLYHGQEDIYQTDEEGNVQFIEMPWGKEPIILGTKPGGYSAYEFYANIATSGGEAESVEFGIDPSGYEAKILAERNSLPITETSIIWTKQPEVDENGYAQADTADYQVVGVYPSLNFTVFLLDKTVNTPTSQAESEV